MTKETITANTGIDVKKLRCCLEGSFYPNGELELEIERLRINPDKVQIYEGSSVSRNIDQKI